MHVKSLLFVAALVTPLSAHAEDVVLQSGNWRISMDMRMVMNDDVELVSESSQETECWLSIEDRALSPKYFEDGECTLTNTETTSFGFKGVMACTYDNLTVAGDLIAEANSARDAFAARVEMTDNIGMNMKGEILFLGHLDGSC